MPLWFASRNRSCGEVERAAGDQGVRRVGGRLIPRHVAELHDVLAAARLLMVTDGATPDCTGTRPMVKARTTNQFPWPRFFVTLNRSSGHHAGDADVIQCPAI